MIQTMSFRTTVRLVAALNLAYFGFEIVAAWRTGAVSLFADSADFLEDASVNLLIGMALAWSPRQRATLGRWLAAILCLPALGFLWALWTKWGHPVPPEPLTMSLTGAGAIFVNLGCALLLARHRAAHGSLARAAFLSARNDVLANVAILFAAAVTLVWVSVWPDIAVGLGIAAMNIDAARDVLDAANQERHLATP